MNYIDAINQRHSTRSFCDLMNTEQINFLNLKITELNFKSGLDFILVLDGTPFASFKKSYGLFKNVSSYIVVAGKKDEKYLYQKAGYWTEKLVLDATIQGLSTCIVKATVDYKEIKVRLMDDYEIILVIAIGNGISDNKKSLANKLLHINKKPLDYFYEGNFVSKWFMRGIDCVSKMPSAYNRLPIKFKYDSGKVSIINSSNKDINKIDEGIAVLHFEIGSNKNLYRCFYE